MAHTFARMPGVVDANSPWMTYLRGIYGPSTPCPFDMSTIELLYTDRLPVKLCDMPMCTDCDAWLSQEANETEWQVMHTRSLMTKGSVLLLQRPLHERRGRNGWIEIFRVAYPHEGVGYGCWSWHARGSGIFVRIADSLSFPTRAAAYDALHGTDCSTSAFEVKAIRSQTNGFCSHDFLFALKTRWRGHDALQMLYSNYGTISDVFKMQMHEVVIARSECIDQSRAIGACLPVDVNVGWNASTTSQTCQSHFTHYLLALDGPTDAH